MRTSMLGLLAAIALIGCGGGSQPMDASSDDAASVPTDGADRVTNDVGAHDTTPGNETGVDAVVLDSPANEAGGDVTSNDTPANDAVPTDVGMPPDVPSDAPAEGGLCNMPGACDPAAPNCPSGQMCCTGPVPTDTCGYCTTSMRCPI